MTTYGEQVKAWIRDNEERLSESYRMPQNTPAERELRDAKIDCCHAESRALGALSLMVNRFHAADETYVEPR